MRLSSEFFCLTSLQSGYAGTLLRDSMFIPASSAGSISASPCSSATRPHGGGRGSLLESQGDIEGGVSFCTLWDRDIILESFKAIILVSGNPFFSEDDFLDRLGVVLEKSVSSQANMPFFAEKFGYRRFFIPYETDNPVDLEISRLLYEMEFEETRKWGGPRRKSPFRRSSPLILPLTEVWYNICPLKK